MADEKRVVLVKPGDVLVIGNVGDHSLEDLQRAAEHLKQIGLAGVLLFAADIQLDALTPDDVANLTAMVRTE
ncbi:hypothetical protein [Micromonospora tarensis]|uniref:Uncharacterized protein n=1 Tax=Micromonospora tarensis TaxID=2806100 RepID=A0ABS1YCI6_9ACTN|nr:hypothetical protein [Micromonospora tarensis]MBM0275119.1 hypothetical protein [Micromonospora tarensis]